MLVGVEQRQLLVCMAPVHHRLRLFLLLSHTVGQVRVRALDFVSLVEFPHSVAYL